MEDEVKWAELLLKMPFPDQNFHTFGIVQITSISMFTSPQTLGIYVSGEFQWGECQTDGRGWIGYKECNRTSLAALLKSIYDRSLYVEGLDCTNVGSFGLRWVFSHIPPVYLKVVCMKFAWDTSFIIVVVAWRLRWLLRSWNRFYLKRFFGMFAYDFFSRRRRASGFVCTCVWYSCSSDACGFVSAHKRV